MVRKKTNTMNKKQKKKLETDETLLALKERYFRLALKEQYPNTRNTTKTLDVLEETINKRKEELLNDTKTKTNGERIQES
jgi:hypothetical protein